MLWCDVCVVRQILSNFVFKKYVQLFAKSDGVTLLRPPSKRSPTNTNDSAVYSSGSSFSSRLHRFANTAWCERWRYLNILNYNWSPNLQHGRAVWRQNHDLSATSDYHDALFTTVRFYFYTIFMPTITSLTKNAAIKTIEGCELHGKCLAISFQSFQLST